MDTAGVLKEITASLGIPFIFKSSFDKANRSSGSTFRGPCIDKGLEILAKVKRELLVPVLTDVHLPDQVKAVSEVADMLQTAAFLARQTDLITAAAASGRPVNIKKAQFMAPGDMQAVLGKARAAAGTDGGTIILCERGSSFGYNNLVVDMRGLVIMRDMGCPIVFDATHSVQLPGGGGDRSLGQRQFVAPLARAAMAVGIDGIFMETHPDPDQALSDGPNMVPLSELPGLMRQLIAIAALG
jgi:2-dehydro-3-deoxyphosphooctonate aldolase (KDO 8-P synthase)